MSVSLTNNFWLNARGVTFEDSASATWSLNANLNQISVNLTGSPVGANPTAKVGLAAVNGVATTWMRSDAAPPLDQSISPTMTGTWTWQASSGSTVLVAECVSTAVFAGFHVSNSAAARKLEILYCGSTSAGAYGAAADTSVINAQGGLTVSVNDASVAALSASGVAIVNGFSIRGSPIPAQPTGYGTPTGAALTSSFAAGSISLANLAAEVAQLILDLKKYGIIAA